MAGAKRSKRKSQNVMSSLDRLSDLPDSLLCHILSFLPTRYAVATSLLGRRWRSLWTDVPSLHLEQLDHYRILSEKGDMCFEEIVNRVLLLHNARHLYNFVLEGDLSITKHKFDAWMSAVVARNVQKIEIVFTNGFRDVPVLPRCLFTCKTLVELKLSYAIFPADCAVHLPCLKKLDLNCDIYGNNGWIPRLLSGCLVLEDLVLERGAFPDEVSCCNIYSPTLKRLCLISGWGDDPVDSGNQVNISTPALQYFEFSDNMGQQISAGTLSHLIEAKILLNDPGLECDDYCLSVMELVNKLHNVESLKLKSKMQICNYASSVTARFHNLTILDLAADWCFLIKILELADNLEDLIIRQVDDKLKCWREPHQVPKRMLSHLTAVLVDGVEGKESELGMLRYILWNAKVLETMKICTAYRSTDLDGKNMFEKISSFPKGSETCEVVFHQGCHLVDSDTDSD